MTQSVPSTTRAGLVELLRRTLQAAQGHQLGPAALVDNVARSATKAGMRTSRDAVELAMFAMVKDGRAVWTKEGPVRLIQAYSKVYKIDPDRKKVALRSRRVRSMPTARKHLS